VRGYVGLAEVVVESRNPERLVDFYEVALGWDLEPDGADTWRAQLGCTCLVIRRGEPRTPITLTWQVDDLDAEIARLRARRNDVARTSSADAWYFADYHDWSAGLTDPDGNRVAFIAPSGEHGVPEEELARFLIARFGREPEVRAAIARQGSIVRNPQWLNLVVRIIRGAESLDEAVAQIDALWRA
jgi:predicted enzyme related to lactoylglutathione lyase